MRLVKPCVQVVWSALCPEMVEGNAIEVGVGAGAAAVDGAADADGMGVAVATAAGSAIAARPSFPVSEIGWSDRSAAARAAAADASGTTRLGSAGSAPVGYCRKTILLRLIPLSASAIETRVDGLVRVSESFMFESAEFASL